MGMRSAIYRIIAVVMFSWAVVAAFSLLSRLGFLVDGIDWSAVLLEISKWISEAVSGYRELLRGLERSLHFPQLPSLLYDIVGVGLFAIARGYRSDRRKILEQHRDPDAR
jgi:hypothetical protein